MRTDHEKRMNYPLLMTAIVMTACLGCQPKEQNAHVMHEDRIESTTGSAVEPAESTEGVFAVAGDAANAAELTPQPATEETDDLGDTEESDTLQAPVKGEESADPEMVTSADIPIVPSTDQTPAAAEESAHEAVSAQKDEPSNELEPTSDPERVGPRIYAACKELLNTYVDGHGNVDYTTLRRKRGELYGIVREFENVNPQEYLPWGRNEKIAFWLNAYNIFTLKIVIDNYPIEPSWSKVILNYPKNSIVHIRDAWTKQYFSVMGLQYTLREIEREMLLGRFKDPRVCLALSYASMGGAMLRNEPYLPDRIDEQLDDQSRKFLADPRGFEIDRVAQKAYLADIFNWYKQDFVAAYGDIRKFRDKPQPIQAYLNFIITRVSAADAQYLETQPFTVEFRKYDWRLNEQPNK